MKRFDVKSGISDDLNDLLSGSTQDFVHSAKHRTSSVNFTNRNYYFFYFTYDFHSVNKLVDQIPIGTAFDLSHGPFHGLCVPAKPQKE